MWWCGECGGGGRGKGGGGGGEGCFGWWTTPLHLLEVAVHCHHPLLHRLHLLSPFLLLFLVLLIQLYVPPIHLLELPTSALIHSVHAPDPGYPPHLLSKSSFRHRGWRIWSIVGGSKSINLVLVATANRLGSIITL